MKIRYLIINLFLLLLLFSGILTPIAALERSWNEEDKFVSELEIHSISTIVNKNSDLKETIPAETEVQSFQESHLKIVDIIKSNKTIVFEEYSISSLENKPLEYSETYNSTELGEIYKEGYISPSFAWDIEESKIILISVLDSLFLLLFVEPEWSDINVGLSEGLDRTKVVDTIYNGAEWVDVTFGKFLDDYCKSFEIMEKEVLSQAKEEFKETVHKWTFMFDLSGGLSVPVYDPVESKMVQLKAEECFYEFSLEYDEGGTFKEYKTMYKEVYTLNNITTTNEETFVYKFKTEGFFSFLGSPFDFLYGFFGLLMLCTITFVVRKR